MQCQIPHGYASFRGACDGLLSSLQEAAESALPPGWRLAPFGSFKQGTCLPGTSLDVALVPGKDADAASVSPDVVRDFASDLARRKTDFALLSTEKREGPLRMQVGEFVPGGNHQDHPNVLALHVGDAATCRRDELLGRLLSSNGKAQVFIMLIKYWARGRGLIGPKFGGSFPWTLLAVFVLQQKGLLPPLRDICEGQQPEQELPLAGPQASMPKPSELLLCFVDTVLGHVSEEAPRRRMCLWTGTFVPQEEGKAPPVFAGQGAPRRAHFVEELRRMQQILRNEELAAPKPSSFGAASAAGQGGSATPPRRRQPAKLLSPIQEGPDPAESGHLPETTFEKSTIPHFPQFLDAASLKGGKRSNVRVHINADWVATCTRDNRAIEVLQLDPSLMGNLDREAWEARFERRFHQVKIGKATAEYRRWSEHFRRHGRHPGDPVTPRALALNSKKQFELDYAAWRKELHCLPPRR